MICHVMRTFASENSQFQSTTLNNPWLPFRIHTTVTKEVQVEKLIPPISLQRRVAKARSVSERRPAWLSASALYYTFSDELRKIEHG